MNAELGTLPPLGLLTSESPGQAQIEGEDFIPHLTQIEEEHEREDWGGPSGERPDKQVVQPSVGTATKKGKEVAGQGVIDLEEWEQY